MGQNIMNWLAPLWNERGSIGGSKKKERTQESSTQTQQTQVTPASGAEQQQRNAAQQSELFRMFLMQKLAQEQFAQPLMTPHAQQGLDVLNRQFSDQQDQRGLQGNASPIENARAQGMSSDLAQLQNDAFQKRLAMSGALSPSAGSLGMMGMQQQERMAGSPTTMSRTGTSTGTGGQTQGGFDLGSMGNFMTGIGNLYGAGQKGGLWGTQAVVPQTGGPVGGYGGGFFM
jgi:hypothetical protein